MDIRKTKNPYVKLKREFYEISQVATESDDFDLAQAFRVGGRLQWKHLLEEYRVILLAEAGAGKTREIEEAASQLREAGKPAFFLRLELVTEGVDDAFEVGNREGFDKWRASSDEGWVLLDSIDEARLKDPKDFERAIRKMSAVIGSAMERTHLIITGRTTAWRPKTDLDLCQKHFPLARRIRAEKIEPFKDSEYSRPDYQTENTREKSSESIFKIVTLEDLRSSQIVIFVKARGVEDTVEFLDAIERADAWSFTARPQDLEELTEFWADKGRIGSRLELMRNSVRRRLAERDQDRAELRTLSEDRATRAIKLIAAAVALTHDQTLRVPDGTSNDRGMPINQLLGNWDARDLSTLLSRPIFDEAIYGTVRFHHRTVWEYLAAEWFHDLLKEDTSRRKIESHFFKKQYGLDVVVPSLRPILPWLAIFDERIRDRLAAIEPEVVLEGGDPSHLPLSVRRHILKEVCQQLAAGAPRHPVHGYDAIQRFAHDDLGDEIRDLLETFKKNETIVDFLMRMIWLGRIASLAQQAKAVAEVPTASRYTRIAAMRAVRAVGSSGDQEDVRRSFLGEADELSRECLTELIAGAPRSRSSQAWLLACLAKVTPKRSHSFDGLSDAVAEFADGLQSAVLRDFVSGMNVLLDKPPHVERRFVEVSERFQWLLEPAARSVYRLIRERDPAALEEDALSILYKVSTSRFYGSDIRDDKIDFGAAVSAWQDLNRAMLWYDVRESRRSLDKGTGARLTQFWQTLSLGSFWKFDEYDFDYAVAQITSQKEIDDRLVALSLAFTLYKESNRPASWLQQLKDAAAGSAELLEQLEVYLSSTANEKAQARERRQLSWQRELKKRERDQERNREKWRSALAAEPDRLRRPGLDNPADVSTWQDYVCETLREKGSRASRWANGNWRDLIGEFGEEVAQAFRDGAVAYWRHYRPVLLSEGAPANTTPHQVIFGLTGLEIEARETSNWARALEVADVEIACRYACHELNGFPTWFPNLFDARPEQISNFLFHEICFELNTEVEGQERHHVLDDISWSGQWCWDRLAPMLLAKLRSFEPKSLHSLDQTHRILQGSSVSDDDLARLAERKVGEGEAVEHRAQWYAVWVGVEPDRAIHALESALANISSGDDQTRFAMSFAISLVGGRLGEKNSARAAFRVPHHLKTLYLLMHQYIRQEQDIDRASGGVYTPDTRDKAQEARDQLFQILNQIPGKEAYLALEELSRAHPVETARPWFADQARRKAEIDADMTPWSAAQVREFQDELERTPANHRELAELAAMRLQDLRYDLEEGDSSIAQTLRRVTDEVEMRKFIGRELREKSHGRYSVPQEEEFADAKRADYRFHGSGIDAPVPVELKLADKWTGPALLERLENQLCGDYLRDDHSRRGIFVLVYRGERKGWDMPEPVGRVDFGGLVLTLQDHWTRISPRFPKIDEITVIGIDLTRRTCKL